MTIRKFFARIIRELYPIKHKRPWIYKKLMKDIWRLPDFPRGPEFKQLKKIQKIIKKNSGKWYSHDYMLKEHAFYPETLKWLVAGGSGAGKSFLDVGAFAGTMSVYAKKLLGYDVHSIDFVDKHTPKKLFDEMGINFSLCNIELEQIPFKKQFDVIWFTECLEHFNFYPVPTLQKLHAALKPGGILYLTTPNSKMWGRRTVHHNNLSEIPMPGTPGVEIKNDHIWQYNVTELLHVVDAADFAVIDFDYAWEADADVARKHFNLKLMRKQDVKI